jgi:hypothetical protein
LKQSLFTLLGILIIVLAPLTVSAQETGDYHPFLTDKFNIGIGVFSPNKSFGIQVDGSDPGEEIDFDETLKTDDSQTTPTIDIRWRFGEKWSLSGQYWKVDSKGSTVLTQDVEWEDLVFKEGSFVSAGTDMSVARVFFGRTMMSGPQYEFGLGAGFHWMDIGAFIEGDIILEDGGTDFQHGDADATFPLPNLGVWYMYSWSPKWLVIARADWLSVTFGDYSGNLWSASAGINYQAFKNVGFGLSYTAFDLSADVDKNDWHGKVGSEQHGPRLTVTASW